MVDLTKTQNIIIGRKRTGPIFLTFDEIYYNGKIV